MQMKKAVKLKAKSLMSLSSGFAARARGGAIRRARSGWRGWAGCTAS